ncbi:receptor-like protein EIX2 isoform X3 [Rosa chinensis]|uniref:receptor-like protein EIX2 isoform X3 n=1 Tax=Rosa chinensis TaxID=74649 RepID=UPI000D0868CB|nr:receptor-like protein EIX2 isoform X3 [Rosa chinensis]
MACHKVAAAPFQLLSLVSFLLFLNPCSSIFLQATTIFAYSNTVNDERANVACIEEERKALLEFKQGLQDPMPALHSWVGKDCCNWHGIVCNNQTGKIPEGIGSLHKLEALDLSGNHLWGLIPSSMTSMTALSKLNLSFNNFSGPIPSANQFLTFNDPTSFEGNSGLCGPPLPTQCSSVNDPAVKVDEDEEDKYGKLWFYASTSLGFIVGFWVAFGSLVIKRSWRHAYFQFLDNMKDKLCFCFWK